MSEHTQMPLVGPIKRRGWREVLRLAPLTSSPHAALVVTRRGRIVSIVPANSPRLLSDYLTWPYDFREVDTRERLLEVDQRLESCDPGYEFSVALRLSYQVAQPGRVALEIEDAPIELAHAISQSLRLSGREFGVDQAKLFEEHLQVLLLRGEALAQRLHMLGLMLRRADATVTIDDRTRMYAEELRYTLRERPLHFQLSIESLEPERNFDVYVGGVYQLTERRVQPGPAEATEAAVQVAITRALRRVGIMFAPGDYLSAAKAMAETLRKDALLQSELLVAQAQLLRPTVQIQPDRSMVHVPQPAPQALASRRPDLVLRRARQGLLRAGPPAALRAPAEAEVPESSSLGRRALPLPNTPRVEEQANVDAETASWPAYMPFQESAPAPSEQAPWADLAALAGRASPPPSFDEPAEPRIEALRRPARVAVRRRAMAPPPALPPAAIEQDATWAALADALALDESPDAPPPNEAAQMSSALPPWSDLTMQTEQESPLITPAFDDAESAVDDFGSAPQWLQFPTDLATDDEAEAPHVAVGEESGVTGDLLPWIETEAAEPQDATLSAWGEIASAAAPLDPTDSPQSADMMAFWSDAEANAAPAQPGAEAAILSEQLGDVAPLHWQGFTPLPDSDTAPSTPAAEQADEDDAITNWQSFIVPQPMDMWPSAPAGLRTDADTILSAHDATPLPDADATLQAPAVAPANAEDQPLAWEVAEPTDADHPPSEAMVQQEPEQLEPAAEHDPFLLLGSLDRQLEQPPVDDELVLLELNEQALFPLDPQEDEALRDSLHQADMPSLPAQQERELAPWESVAERAAAEPLADPAADATDELLEQALLVQIDDLTSAPDLEEGLAAWSTVEIGDLTAAPAQSSDMAGAAGYRAPVDNAAAGDAVDEQVAHMDELLRSHGPAWLKMWILELKEEPTRLQEILAEVTSDPVLLHAADDPRCQRALLLSLTAAPSLLPVLASKPSRMLPRASAHRPAEHEDDIPDWLRLRARWNGNGGGI